MRETVFILDVTGLRCPGKHQIDSVGLRKEVRSDYIIQARLQRDGHELGVGW